jgi:hypothetical protein
MHGLLEAYILLAYQVHEAWSVPDPTFPDRSDQASGRVVAQMTTIEDGQITTISLRKIYPPPFAPLRSRPRKPWLVYLKDLVKTQGGWYGVRREGGGAAVVLAG